jgi:hypothetical protein
MPWGSQEDNGFSSAKWKGMFQHVQKKNPHTSMPGKYIIKMRLMKYIQMFDSIIFKSNGHTFFLL